MDDIYTALKALDAEVDDALERFMNDENLYLKYVRNFPEEPTMAALVQATEARDFDAAEKASHALKGIANNLGFVPLADAAMDMLEELRDGNTQAALEEYPIVQKQYHLFTQAIEAWRSA